MPEDRRKDNEFDIFIANSIYPEASSIFTFKPQSLQEVKENCCIILDTNVLLVPYTLYKGDILEQCKTIYSKLISEERLIVPGQVAREFAENRATKLGELYQKFSRRKQIQSIYEGNYPLLSNFEEYKEVIRLEKEIDAKQLEYKQAIHKIMMQIEQWSWNDPVSLLYNSLFTEKVILDIQIDKEKTKSDLERRQIHKIPPGYKDAGKDDKGIGDLLIWYTILEIGRTQNRSVVFVSNDGKPDWFKQSEKSALYLRYELIEEFRRASAGHSLHVVKFSDFLEMYGANQRLIEEIRKKEEIKEEASQKSPDYALNTAAFRYHRGIRKRLLELREVILLIQERKEAGIYIGEELNNQIFRLTNTIAKLPPDLFILEKEALIDLTVKAESLLDTLEHKGGTAESRKGHLSIRALQTLFTIDHLLAKIPSDPPEQIALF